MHTLDQLLALKQHSLTTLPYHPVNPQQNIPTSVQVKILSCTTVLCYVMCCSTPSKQTELVEGTLRK